jgi:hypothetical protein
MTDIAMSTYVKGRRIMGYALQVKSVPRKNRRWTLKDSALEARKKPIISELLGLEG